MNLPRLPKLITKIVNRRLVVVSVLWLFGAIALVVSLLPSGAASQNGQRKRIIEETPYPGAPVQIVSVTNRRHPIKLRESFEEDDDWLKGLEIQVVNKSGKTVTHVGIDIIFERPANQAGGPPAFWPLTYGLNPFSLKIGEPILTDKIKPIRPGERISIELSDLAYVELKALLKDTYYLDVDKVKIFVTTIGFDDGTAWGGSYYIRDPDKPTGWRPKETGSTKKSAAFPLSYHHPPKWNAERWFKAALLEEAECGHADSLRHTYITHLLANAVDAPTVMQYSGHKSFQSFSVYLHKTEMGDKRACLILEEVDHFLTTSGALKTLQTNGTQDHANDAPAYPLQNHRIAGLKRKVAWLAELSVRCALRNARSHERLPQVRSLQFLEC